MKKGQRVEWMGSRTAAPGPGEDGRLFGVVAVTQTNEAFSVKVEWENGRVTRERSRNLRVAA